MQNKELFEALSLIEKEKGIPKTYMLEKIEAALLSAFRKDFSADTAENVSLLINESKYEIKLMVKKTVVEEVENPSVEISLDEAKRISKRLFVGDVTEVEIKTKNFGRKAAETAKQVIIQGMREAERGLLYQEFQSKQHEILTGIVVRVDNKSKTIVMEIGKTEAILPVSEQIPGESFKEGDRIKVYVVDVKDSSKGTQVAISRTHPGLVKRLFELEVPEIYDGVIEVKSISREAGSRSKIAVFSKDPHVDPIGSCIGANGARVSTIVKELKGEKIDIIRWEEDPLKFIAAALSPSEVVSVIQNEGEKNCQVIVPDNQLSLAIGKEGQNARLAAKLTGWKIDIKPESQA